MDNDNEGEVHEEPHEEDAQPDSRTSTSVKRRKRGARKNKAKDAQAEQVDLTLETLAEASQTLAREISRTSKISGNGYVIDPSDVPVPPIPSDAVPPTPTVTKKPSKWKLSFGKSNGDRSPTVPTPSPAVEESVTVDGRQMSKTASNVTNLVLGLSPPPPKSSRSPSRQQTSVRHGPTQPLQPFDDSTYARGRRKNSPYGNNGGTGSQSHIEKWADNVEKRGVSPTSTRSGRYLASSASSMASSNWRSSINTTNSIRSATTSSSAFTRYSNNSSSTVATSVSSGSWRNANGSKYSVSSGQHHRNGNLPPPNVKRTCPTYPPTCSPIDTSCCIVMTGVPWELNEMPRQMHPNPVGDIFGSPPPQRKRGNGSGARNNKQTTGATKENNKLDTISERPSGQSMDASTSTTDLGNGGSAGKEGDLLDGAGPKKVPKGQINALAKMLSALRR